MRYWNVAWTWLKWPESEPGGPTRAATKREPLEVHVSPLVARYVEAPDQRAGAHETASFAFPPSGTGVLRGPSASPRFRLDRGWLTRSAVLYIDTKATIVEGKPYRSDKGSSC